MGRSEHDAFQREADWLRVTRQAAVEVALDEDGRAARAAVRAPHTMKPISQAWLLHPCNELRWFRLRAGLTQARAAVLLGTSQAHMSKLERLKSWPRGKLYERVSLWLDQQRAALREANR